MLDRFGIRRAAERKIAGLEPVIDGRLNKTGFGEVPRHDFRLGRHDFGESLLERAGNLPVQLMPAALGQALKSPVPPPRMLEAGDGFPPLRAAGHQPPPRPLLPPPPRNA